MGLEQETCRSRSEFEFSSLFDLRRLVSVFFLLTLLWTSQELVVESWVGWLVWLRSEKIDAAEKQNHRCSPARPVVVAQVFLIRLIFVGRIVEDCISRFFVLFFLSPASELSFVLCVGVCRRHLTLKLKQDELHRCWL